MKPYKLSPEASDSADEIVANIAYHFSDRRAERYRVELLAALSNLGLAPNRWPVDRIKDGIPVRKYIFQEKTIVLYSEREAFISIDVIADARTDWR